MSDTIRVELHSLNTDLTFAAKGDSGHWLMIDSKAENGGNAAGSNPSELLLQALGACTGMDTLSILKKKRTPFSHLDIFVAGIKREEHPRIYTEIRLRFVLHSAGGEKALADLRRAVDLSYDKYCTVANMLKSGTKITYDTEIVDG
ncbi:MAG: OsmC family protein [Candidatus Neomarinimicrobiota bacterium]|jgi:putative redox protein|nr:OsmC family protein [Candidatus Neomarinimicrobiota bacterium]MDD3966568.1 OsmC family protein [Candidatus Neomarinimicrobiota bacterium]MDX9780495.1 OsmC family protein [bacterium]